MPRYHHWFGSYGDSVSDLTSFHGASRLEASTLSFHIASARRIEISDEIRRPIKDPSLAVEIFLTLWKQMLIESFS